MAKKIEYRKVVVRYEKENECIKQQKHFGWQLNQKTLLNRFGNPLVSTAGIDEDDLREKCSWELSFIREVEETKIIELSNLQSEYDSYMPLDTSFGKGRITGAVWLSLFSFACIIGGAVWVGTPGIALAIALILVGIIVFGIPVIIVFTTGAGRVARIIKENERREMKRKEIALKAKELLNN